MDDLEKGFRAVRKYADDTGYGRYISDDMCREIARLVLEAVEKPAPALDEGDRALDPQ